MADFLVRFYYYIVLFRRCRTIKRTELNEEIRDREVRVVGDDGEQLGIMTSREALEVAIEKKLDLVKIAPQAKPPVCKIMDYGKHRYEQQKREKENKKKAKSSSLKEVRLSLKIEKHDLETKANQAIKFLKNGDKLKVSLRFRGREMGYINLGHGVIERFTKEIEEYGKLDKRPSMEGRSLVAFYLPLK
ncbi:translation initiation factor IF-3 [Helicovermis profundi]